MRAGVLSRVREAMAGACATRPLYVEGLKAELRALDPASIEWVLKYMQPLSLIRAHETQTAYTIGFLYSDEIVCGAIRELDDTGLVRVRRGGRDHYIRRAQPTPRCSVYCDPDEGVLWIGDIASNTIYLVVSSRTRHPAIAFARLTLELVTSYLGQEGWTLFHAGAVNTPQGALLVVGDGGAGKTSLLLALLSAGARFIANELLFAREYADGVRVLGYPMRVAVGLGTALQFAPLADRIDSPGELEFPRNRLKLRRVINTPRERWKDLDDKLQLLPPELCEILAQNTPVPGGTLCTVVVPAVSTEPAETKVEHLSHDAVLQLLSRNHIGVTKNGEYGLWVEMNLKCASSDGHASLLARLCELNPMRFRFCVALDNANEMRTYASRLLGARAPLARPSCG